MHLPVRAEIKVIQTAKDHTNRIGGKYNPGLDFAAMLNEKCFATDDGKVLKVVNLKGASYGLYVLIQHNGFRTLYAHLSRVVVKVGDEVKEGQQIASTGTSGNSAGPHLHFEYRECQYTSDGKEVYTAVDPAPYLGLELPETLSGSHKAHETKEGRRRME